MNDQADPLSCDVRMVVVTLNPTFDLILEVNDFQPGRHQLGRELQLLPAGKGLNVCRTLDSLGVSSIISGFVGQQSVLDFEQAVQDSSITSQFFTLPGHTRRNVTILDPVRNIDTHIRQTGLRLSKQDLQRMGKKLSLLAEKGRLIVFAGSLPPGVGTAALARLLRICKDEGARTVIDTSGVALAGVLKQGPWLIKPNREEFAQLTGQDQEQQTIEQMVLAAKQLTGKVENVLLSLGSRGAVLMDRCCAIHAYLEPSELGKIKIRNTVGCGDALLGGFLAGTVRSQDVRTSLARALAVSAAACETASPAVFDPELFRNLQNQVRIQELARW